MLVRIKRVDKNAKFFNIRQYDRIINPIQQHLKNRSRKFDATINKLIFEHE